jgi:glycerophosphoryl diester phosphodiesterase
MLMSCKLFSHRGFLTESLKENTIKSFQNAILNNFEAIEVDIWYDKEILILSHNKPQKDLDKYDRLKDLFHKFGNKITYWLDFKNLNIDNYTKALSYLKVIIKKHNIDSENIILAPYLDTLNIENNLFIYDALRKNFGSNCNIAAVIRVIKKENWEEYYKKLASYKINNLSVEFNNIDKDFMELFHNINIFTWTVNKQDDLEFLTELGITNIATDKILPKTTNEKRR